MRCTALAETTGERCRRHAVRGMSVCASHPPVDWNPRLDRPPTLSRFEVEALFDGKGRLLVNRLLLLMWGRIHDVERSNLSMLSKIEQSLPLDDMVSRLAVMRRVLALCQDAADLLQSLEVDDATDQLERAFRGSPHLHADQKAN